MRRLLAVSFVVLLLIGTAPVPGSGHQDAGTGNPESITTAEDFDRVQFRIVAYENGSARWTFHYERTLENETDRQRFQEFADEFNSQNTRLYSDFRSQARSLAESGQNATGRQMAATNFSKDAFRSGLDDSVGTVEMSFTWTNFSATDGGSVVLGDVFKGGLYLAPNQSLVVERGEKLQFESVDPMPDEQSEPALAESDSVTWQDEHEFADNQPRVELVSNSSQSIGDIASPGDDGGDSWMMTLAGIVVVLLGLGAAIAWRRGGFGFGIGGSGPGNSAEAATAAAGGSASGVNPPVSDEELLTDEARVKKLLRDNGGRMKQVNIVDETGWSKSKVSMLLSDMADQGEISKLRVGRENIISLDGHEPEAARSPHEE